MTDSASAPIFADRYQFKPVGDDWDTGRSGFTHLVYDLKENRLGVIKRAEVSSLQAVQGLKNEVAALRALKGFGVPEVYDTGLALYGSQRYFYIVMEYIEGMRVERNLPSLSVIERVDILTQFLGLLTVAHRKGIVNGDVDLKHLFWLREKRQLVVIDWGNTKVGVDPNKSTEFSYDLARAAEVIFSLVTRHHPPSTGSITLPNDSALAPELQSIPVQFRELCKWAPRTPPDSAKSPYTSLELFEVSKKWLAVAAVYNSKSNNESHPKLRWPYLVGVFVLLAILIAFLSVFIVPKFPLLAATASVTFPSTETPVVSSFTPTLTETSSPTVTSTKTSSNPTEIVTPTPIIIPPPLTYSAPFFYFDNKVTFSSSPLRLCWRKANFPLDLAQTEGFYRRGDYDWWLFGVAEWRPVEQPVEVDFSQCFSQKKIGAMALNAFVTRLEPERDNAPAREFGFFLEDQKGNRREYTLWIDQGNKLYLRIRENNNIFYDDLVQAVSLANLQTDGNFPRIYNKFPIQIFLEIDNQGLDILYLQDAPHDFVENSNLKPGRRIDDAVRLTLGNIQKIGLIGYGGETTVLIWPLVFFER